MKKNDCVVVSGGSGTEIKLLSKHESTFIPLGAKHRLSNMRGRYFKSH